MLVVDACVPVKESGDAHHVGHSGDGAAGHTHVRSTGTGVRGVTHLHIELDLRRCQRATSEHQGDLDVSGLQDVDGQHRSAVRWQLGIPYQRQ